MRGEYLIMSDIRILSVKSLSDIKYEIAKIGVEKGCIDSLSMKGKFLVFKITELSAASCNIIKQTALSAGTDAAVHRNVITGNIKKSSLLLFGSLKEIERVAEKLRGQPFGLDIISEKLFGYVNGSKKNQCFLAKRHAFEIGERVYTMGVLNVTPDSFSDGGQFAEVDSAVSKALEMVQEGADIIDIGGESSRPGSDPVSQEKELNRVLPIIERLREQSDIPISIDTYKSAIAAAALDSGADIVNDISGLRFDEDMITVVRERKAGLIIMHMKGSSKHMQDNPHYEDVIQEIYDFLKERTHYAINNGIEKEYIAIDPGIGFGKRLIDNYDILDRFHEFTSLGYPLLIGASRKSFIGTTLDVPVNERLEGSLASLALAIEGGVAIVRVHDVKETVRFMKMYETIRKRNN